MLFDLCAALRHQREGFPGTLCPSPGTAVSKEMSVLTMSPKMEFAMWYVL